MRPPVTFPRVTARPGEPGGSRRSRTPPPSLALSRDGPSRHGPPPRPPARPPCSPPSRRGPGRRSEWAPGPPPGAYPPPPATRCSRPASLRSSPKHCVQQQFPIACRPGAAAPPPLLPLRAQAPGPAAASARHEPKGASGTEGGPAGARRREAGAPGGTGVGTKAVVTPEAAGSPPRDGSAPGCGLPTPSPPAWPLARLSRSARRQ